MNLDMAALYETYRDALRKHVGKLMRGQPDDVDDVVQQTFVKALANAGSYADIGYSPATWLYRIATNLVIDRRRRYATSREDGRPRVHFVPFDLEAHNAPSIAASRAYASVEHRAALVPAIDALTPQQRHAVVAYYYDDAPTSETASVMGITDNAVKKLRLRGLAQLRRTLTQEDAA